MAAGGYRISKKTKEVLLDIYRLAGLGREIIDMAEGLNPQEKVNLKSNYNRIMKTIRKTGV